MMANFTAGDWGKLFELFPGRVLRGERGTNKVITKGWNRFDAGNTVTERELLTSTIQAKRRLFAQLSGILILR